MRSCDILIFHPTSGWGGAERTTLNIVRSLVSSGIGVTVLTNKYLFASENISNLVFEIASFLPWFNNWSSIFKDLVRFSMLLRIVKPKIVIAMMPYAAFLTSVAKRLSPHPFIYVASPRGSCSSYLRHFVRSRKDKIRYKIFF